MPRRDIVQQALTEVQGVIYPKPVHRERLLRLQTLKRQLEESKQAILMNALNITNRLLTRIAEWTDVE
jgi:hypothetical protein